MIESLLIKDVDMVLPDGIRHGDIFIKQGRIAAVDWHLSVDAEQVIYETVGESSCYVHVFG